MSNRPRALNADEQQQHRRRRAVARVQTCRDAFRLLGFLSIADPDRKAVARQLIKLEQLLSPQHERGAPSPIRNPEAALARLSRDQLDPIERCLSTIEDRLLALDDTVPDATFLQAVETGKHNLKLLARYGRLMASRRFTAGPRRDRFEWLATYLLTRTTEAGGRRLLPRDKARVLLEYMVGGLPHKVSESELDEAVIYMREALARLERFETADQFFDSGFFLDVHGYKVSMRDQLLNPDFVYLSVAINVKLHNRLERWIQQREALHNANQLTREGSPRERIMGKLREQQHAVENIFGVKPRPAVSHAPRSLAPTQAKQSSTPARRKQKPARKRTADSSIGGELIKVLLLLVLVLATGAYLAFEMGYIQITQQHAVKGADLSRISPYLYQGTMVGSDDQRHFEGRIHSAKWGKLDERAKREAAEHLADALKREGVQTATITTRRGAPVITVRYGVLDQLEL